MFRTYIDSEFLWERQLFFCRFPFIILYREQSFSYIYSSGHGGQVPSVPLSVWKRRRTDRPAAGRAGEGERLFVLLLTLVLVLVLMLMLVLLLLLLVLVVMVVVVVAMFGGRSLLSKHWERSRCHWVHSHLQRGLFLPCSLPCKFHTPLGFCGGCAITAWWVLGY